MKPKPRLRVVTTPMPGLFMWMILIPENSVIEFMPHPPFSVFPNRDMAFQVGYEFASGIKLSYKEPVH